MIMEYGQLILNAIPDIIATMVGLYLEDALPTKYFRRNGRI